jgi:LmbE family N-acetylglucosaminyl deacetylase
LNLIVSPHPDDAEYSMSGTILKTKNEQFDIAVFSFGGDNDPTRKTHNRVKECYRFWKDVSNVSLISPRTNKTLDELREWELVSTLDKILSKKPYQAVYVTSIEDNHFEHRKMNEAVRASLRGKAISLIEYYSPSTYNTWNANKFVDIQEHYQEKKRRLYEFESQRHQNYFNESNINIFHDDYFCKLRGLEKVEKFKIIYKFA